MNSATPHQNNSSSPAAPLTDHNGTAPPLESPCATNPDDEHLLELTHVQWQLGDWQTLVNIQPKSFSNHPNRVKIALLITEAHLQKGQLKEVEPLIDQAKEWGASKEQIYQAIVGSLYNSLARIATAGGNQEQARLHLEQAFAISLPGCDASMLAQSRNHCQVAVDESFANSKNHPHQLNAKDSIEHAPQESETSHQILQSQPTNHKQLAFYQTISDDSTHGTPPPFVLLDSKSLPRSGLHYLKNTFQRLLGDHFSFCEWYQEVGCCKQHPCALTCYARYAQETGKFRLRLIKSHDFNHDEPALPPSITIQRLILVRDPLYILTSWFELDRLGAHRETLLNHGINIQKLWLTHEREVLDAAYRVIEGCFVAPSTDQLAQWLRQKANYIVRFMNSWAKPAIEHSSPHVHLVDYEEIQRFVIKISLPYREYLSITACKALDDYAINADNLFQKRKNPFSARAECVATFINNQASYFEEAAHCVRSQDQSGYFISHAAS